MAFNSLLVFTYVLLTAFSQTVHSDRSGNITIHYTLQASSESLEELKAANGAQIDLNDICTFAFIPDFSICGAIITTGHAEIQIRQSQKTNGSALDLKQENLSAPEMATVSINFIGNLDMLPFHFTTWPEVLTGLCPSHHNRKSHKSENAGLSHSHYQVWMDFIFFDHDVLGAVRRNEVEEVYNSTAWSSTGGAFSASKSGSLWKNNLPFTEDDIIVIIEGDALVAVKNISEIMRNEFTNMTTDLLTLGWRDTRPAHNLLASSFAYALTRRGARIAVKYFDPCGRILDMQLSTMARHGRLSHRNLNYLPVDIMEAGSKAHGIFVEKNKHIGVA
jgi:hypothetical protein